MYSKKININTQDLNIKSTPEMVSDLQNLHNLDVEKELRYLQDLRNQINLQVRKKKIEKMLNRINEK